MRQLSTYISSLGVVIFLAATFLFWEPSFKHPPKIDESNRGAFFDITKYKEIVIAVGEHGRILYSCDEGKSWISAISPTNLSLTSIFLLNDNLGWITGYDGIILKTENGGLTWTSVKNPSTTEQPLFAIWFKNENVGLAVGADSMVYRTNDGGAHWQSQKLNMQAHLYSISETADGTVWISGENQALYFSKDLGKTWKKLKPPFLTSFFGSITLSDQLLTFGLRGRVCTWKTSGLVESKTESDESLSAGTHLEDGRIVLAGQRGKILVGQKDGKLFHSLKTPIKEDIASLIETSNSLIIVGNSGIYRILKSELGL
ncbi:MAG: hypothetical protein H6754_06490 [Candidatus Omnitrophica bacterium]|nr:hypothetical protein [Candidatus Omnitrophota bacterium]